MPGSIFQMHCRNCGASHEIHTGVSYDYESKRRWAYDHMVCDRCRILVTAQEFEDGERDPSACPECQGSLRAWEGRKWHERLPYGGVGGEHVVGPCPNCQAEISNAYRGGVIEIGLWD